MTQQWFYTTDKKTKLGPVPAGQLVALAKAGQLRPTDLVMKEGTQKWVEAGKVPGLFGAETPKPVPPVPTQQSAAKSSSTGLIIILGSVAGAFVVLCCGILGVGAVLGGRMEAATRAEMSEGDALWEKGDKAGALTKYRAILDGSRSHFLRETDQPRLYGRVIDAEFEKGNVVDGKKLLEAAFSKKNMVPSVNHAEAKDVLAAIQAEKRRAEEEKQQAAAKKQSEKELAEAEAKEKIRKQNRTPLDELKEAKLGEFVEGATLYSEFNGNQIAAEQKYKGKTIYVAGEISEVGKSPFGTAFIMLTQRRGIKIPGVRCYLSSEGAKSSDLTSLRPGDWVKVRGDCGGTDIIGIVDVNNCVFLKVGD